MSKNWWQKLTPEEKIKARKRQSDSYWAAREEHGYFTSKGKPETHGWEADETKIMGPYGIIPSYFVRKCPLYVPDPPEPKKKRRRKTNG